MKSNLISPCKGCRYERRCPARNPKDWEDDYCALYPEYLWHLLLEQRIREKV